MKYYSPFKNSFEELTTADLAELKNASEGWYIEYKSQLTEPSAAAKSISAFSNTYGGWIFIGIKEESKENSVAGAFPGLPRKDVDACLQRLRKSAADLLNPSPHFETKVLWGPDENLGLPTDHGVICVQIPRSSITPHIHKSGVIYRRISDSSEPKPENDRFILDQLWQRSVDLKKAHKRWYKRDPEFSKQENEFPYLRVMLLADPWDERNIWLNSSEQEIRDSLNQKKGRSNIPFDTVYSSPRGVIGRQLVNNDPHNLSMTCEIRRNLQNDFIIPLPSCFARNEGDLRNFLSGYSFAENFLDVIKKYKFSSLRVVDLNYVFNILHGIVEIQKSLCDLAGWNESYFCKIKAINCWRMVPFLDVKSVTDNYEKNGLPMSLVSNSCSPAGFGPEDYIEIQRSFRNENELPHQEAVDHLRSILQTYFMFSATSVIFGTPSLVGEESDEASEPFYSLLEQAGFRALKVQERRNGRAANSN